MVSKLKIHKSTIIFKINIFKLIDKHPKLMKWSITLTFLKNYFKDIKQIYKENSSEFELVKVICLRKIKLTKIFGQTLQQMLQDF